MECSCGGNLIDGKSSYRASKDNFCFIVENIKAYQCVKCGKILFSEETVNKIKKMVNKIEKEINEIVTGTPSIHIYDY